MSHTGGQTQVERFIHGLKPRITAYTLYEVLLESVPNIFFKEYCTVCKHAETEILEKCIKHTWELWVLHVCPQAITPDCY